MNVCGVILSGGKSSRMGTDKSLLELSNKTVIEHISEELEQCSDNLIIVTNEPMKFEFLDLPLIGDRYIDKGPLAGIETAIYHTDADVYLIAACDMPFINKQIFDFLLKQLHTYDAVVPVFEDRMHPLVGVYRKSVLSEIQSLLEKDERKVRSLFQQINVNYIKEFQGISSEALQMHFFNMNNPEQYEQAKHIKLVNERKNMLN